jgi:hypothetical protein
MLQDPSKNDDARFAPLRSSLNFTNCLKVQEITRVPGWESASIRNKAPCVQDVVRLSMIPQKTWTPRPLAHFASQARFNDEIDFNPDQSLIRWMGAATVSYFSSCILR